LFRVAFATSIVKFRLDKDFYAIRGVKKAVELSPHGGVGA